MSNMYSCRLSIIVPVYNVDKYIGDCIDSIKAQTFQDYEVILVDDGSSDKSSYLCDEYAAEDDRVHVIHKTNGGVSSARNAGLDIADGEYIYFIDPDDILADKDALQDMMRFTKDPEIDLIAARGDEFYDGFNIPELLGSNNEYPYRIVTSEAEVRSFVHDALFMVNIYSERILRNVRFDTRITLGEDVLFLTRVVSNVTKAVLYDRLVYQRRLRPESASHANFKEGFFEENELLNQLMYSELNGKAEGDALLEKYFVDQTGLINRLAAEHRKYRRETRIAQQRITGAFPHYLRNKYMNKRTKLFLLMYSISPDLFYFLFSPYKKAKMLHLSLRNRAVRMEKIR